MTNESLQTVWEVVNIFFRSQNAAFLYFKKKICYSRISIVMVLKNHAALWVCLDFDEKFAF